MQLVPLEAEVRTAHLLEVELASMLGTASNNIKMLWYNFLQCFVEGWKAQSVSEAVHVSSERRHAPALIGLRAPPPFF